MGLRRFHLFFIALSVMLAAFAAAWAVGQYRSEPKVEYILAVVLSVGSGAALAVYGAAFQRKTKRLS
jgi:putative Mn2+ efflux pump MntP